MLRGHNADDDLRGVERGVQIAGCCNRFGQDEPGQKAFVDSVSCDALGNFRFVSPEPDMMPNIVPAMVRLVTSQHDCQTGALGACPDDGNAAHLRDAPNFSDFVSDFVTNSVSNLLPSFDSVPEARRPMF